MFLLSALTFGVTPLLGQKPLVYKGKIGSYAVEVQLKSCDSMSGKVNASYRYAKKKNALILRGELSGNVLNLDEIAGKDTTGSWFVVFENDSLTGYWIGKTTQYPVRLKYFSGDRKFIRVQDELSLNTRVSAAKTGRYEVSYYFINDMWFTAENPLLEVGYNGGYVKIKEISDTEIEFNAEMICGPTYHMAFAEGRAEKSGDEYIYTDENGCEIRIKFGAKKLTIQANNSMDCGFGARAYLDHEVLKVKD